MTPNIIFKYSRIYNTILKEYLDQDILNQVPSYQDILRVKADLEEYWNANIERIIQDIEKVSGLKWKTSEIRVYLTSCSKSFSDPLTISISKVNDGRVEIINEEDLNIIIIHELIHMILTDNHDKNLKLSNWISSNYPKEGIYTKTHIAVYAIEWEVLKSLGMENKWKEIAKGLGNREYIKALKIVEEKGLKFIIDMLGRE